MSLRKNKIEPGDIVLVKTYGPIGLFIRLITGDNWNHCGVAINSEDLVEAHPFGSRKRSISRYKKIKILRLKGNNTRLRTKLAMEAEKLIGKKYDFLSILGWILFYTLGTRFNFVDVLDKDTHFYCSELNLTVYNNLGIKLFSDEISHVVPADFEKSSLLKEVL